jgi:uncharacterized protein YukE
MAGKAVSYQFLDALAKSVGMDAETVEQALAEINQLQAQTQALELAVQGKAPTNHASQQPIFGTANEHMYGHVKIAHEVTNDSTDGVAVSPDAVFAYAPDRATTAIVPPPAGVNVPLQAPDTSIFSLYSAYGTIVKKDGIFYTTTVIRVRCTHNNWESRPCVVNTDLSFKCFVQFSGGLIDACTITNGVPSYPYSGAANVTFLLPPYLAFVQ